MNNRKHIEINIGKACNNRCRFCMSSKPVKKELRFASLGEVSVKLKEYRDSGYNSVWFLGGDISIHPDLFMIIATAKKLWYEDIQVITNAMVFDGYEKARLLLASGVTRVNISVHSHLPEIEDFLTQIPGGLRRKIQAILNFVNLYKKGHLKDSLSINIVANKANAKTLPETVLFFYKKLWISDIRINFVWPEWALGEYLEDIILRYDDFLSPLKEIVLLSVEKNIRVTFDTVPPCIFAKIFPKNFQSIVGRFLGEQFDFINKIDAISGEYSFSWKDRKRNELKYQWTSCRSCMYMDSCDGPWREYVEHFWFLEFPSLARIETRPEYIPVNRIGPRKT